MEQVFDARYPRSNTPLKQPAGKEQENLSISGATLMHLPAQQPFRLELCWLRSQAFRWRERNGWYYGVVKDHPIKVRPAGDGIEFHSNVPEASLKSHVHTYFRLEQDIKPVHDALRQADATMRRLVEQYGYVRILRQDPWECLVSYICSQNNNIDRIASIADMLAGKYGDPSVLDGVPCNSFPSPQRLFEVGETELDGLGLGLNRGSLIWTVARDVTEGRLDLNALSRLPYEPYERSKSLLMIYKGIGPKIADCVCLFALDNAEAFPVDRNITAGLLEHYGKQWIREKSTPVLSLWAQQYSDGDARRSRRIDDSRQHAAGTWARKYFGAAHAGYASQLLFCDRIQGTGTDAQY